MAAATASVSAPKGKSRQDSTLPRGFMESPEYLAKRANMQAEVNKFNYKPKERSSEKWKKTPEERLQLANLKLQLFTAIRKHGNDPKKRMNDAEPIRVTVW